MLLQISGTCFTDRSKCYYKFQVHASQTEANFLQISCTCFPDRSKCYYKFQVHASVNEANVIANNKSFYTKLAAALYFPSLPLAHLCQLTLSFSDTNNSSQYIFVSASLSFLGIFHWHLMFTVPCIIVITEEYEPTRCHLLFYCASYRLNIFRALLCPPSGARDYSVDYHVGRFVLGLL